MGGGLAVARFDDRIRLSMQELRCTRRITDESGKNLWVRFARCDRD
jgi:hypothetical protein